MLWFNACGKGDTNNMLPNWAHRTRSSCKEEEARSAGSWGKIEARLAVIRTVPSILMPLGVSGGRFQWSRLCSLCVYEEAQSLHRILFDEVIKVLLILNYAATNKIRLLLPSHWLFYLARFTTSGHFQSPLLVLESWLEYNEPFAPFLLPCTSSVMGSVLLYAVSQCFSY